ncbi:MAG: MBL fold metallo-hydrolase, partial [Lachnospiraceae bacterium]|nr:MBL fold metallo-hydrolase [Candidatus Equihabitans merdae]
MRLYSIASGSSGNCICVSSGNSTILIDAGISGKKIESGMNQLDMTTRDVEAIFVTHEHNDHIRGLGVLARRYGIPIYGSIGTIKAMEKMDALGKIPEGLMHVVDPDAITTIGDLDIDPFRIHHDAADPLGFKVVNGSKQMAVVTDTGHYDEEMVSHLTGLDVVLLESNHDVRMLETGRYPYYLKKRILGEKGHLSNETAGQMLCRLLHDDMKKIFLGHLSGENNLEALALEAVKAEIAMSDIS